MNRTALFAALLAATHVVGLVDAQSYDQPAPTLTCQSLSGALYHHYLPPNEGNVAYSNDGNVQDCDGDPTTPMDYDGEFDHGFGGIQLFADSGDGFSHGTIVCLGGYGHHGSTIHAAEWGASWGPRILVTSDFSRIPPADGPDCGDSYVEPCAPTPPPPSTQPFPVNVVVDTVNGLLYMVFGPGGDGCNVQDRAIRCASTAPPPTVCTVLGPGIDGSYFVFLEPDLDAARIPVWGHVWS